MSDGETVDAQYVLDRDGDIWRSLRGESWECLTTTSCPVHPLDLANVCGPLVELASVAATEAKVRREIRDALLAQSDFMVYENGYPVQAVPVAAARSDGVVVTGVEREAVPHCVFPPRWQQSIPIRNGGGTDYRLLFWSVCPDCGTHGYITEGSWIDV